VKSQEQPYFVLTSEGDPWNGVGGYQLLFFSNINEAAEYISDLLNNVKDDWWPDMDDKQPRNGFRPASSISW
jgi:hypothetical protein